MVGDEPRRAIEQPGEMRGDATLGIAKRCPVGKADQREELIELGRPVDGQRPAAQLAERQRVLDDERCEKYAQR